MSRRGRERDLADPVYCGNFEYDYPEEELEDMFDRYGRVQRIDMKQGYAFVYMADQRDAEDAIARLDGKPVGRRRRRLNVEWAKPPRQGYRREEVGSRETQRREDRKRIQKPTSTLFIANFDARKTREGDLESVFGKYGKLNRCQIKRNYAFIGFDSVDDAKDAMEGTQNMRFNGMNLNVEYALSEYKPDDFRRGRDRGSSRSPRRRERSVSPRRDGSFPPRRERSPFPDDLESAGDRSDRKNRDDSKDRRDRRSRDDDRRGREERERSRRDQEDGDEERDLDNDRDDRKIADDEDDSRDDRHDDPDDRRDDPDDRQDREDDGDVRQEDQDDRDDDLDDDMDNRDDMDNQENGRAD